MKRLLFVLFFLGFSQSAAAQDTIPARRDTAAVDTTRRGVSPAKALTRSLLLPGWGQFSVGAVKRGVFFAAAQGSSYYMLIRTNSRLNDAQAKLATQRALARDSILAIEDVDTTRLEQRIDSVDAVVARQSLVNSRERHMQDWITYTLFFTLASGVDAFVAAHLADFPVAIDATRRTDGATQLEFSVPVPSRRRR